MKRSSVLLILLLLPTLLLAGLTAFQYVNSNSGEKIRLTIRGYDPRDYFQGHYLHFNLVIPAKPEPGSTLSTGPYKYYLSEKDGMYMQNILRKAEKTTSVLVNVNNNAATSFSDLWIEGIPWKDYQKTHP